MAGLDSLPGIACRSLKHGGIATTGNLGRPFSGIFASPTNSENLHYFRRFDLTNGIFLLESSAERAGTPSYLPSTNPKTS
jgi:hypothetical protein